MIPKSLFPTSLNFTRREADPKNHIVWLTDNTAWQSISNNKSINGWEAEYTACFFGKGEEDTGKFVAWIADKIGLDGKIGENKDALARIEKRVQPFISPTVPGCRLRIRIPYPTGPSDTVQLHASTTAGTRIQTVPINGNTNLDGAVVRVSTEKPFDHLGTCHTRFSGSDGWMIISDIDDTIKYTQTPDAVGILRTTFADIPSPITDMPALYKSIHNQFQNSAWFYLSASPYQLYPFLRSFLQDHYPPGETMLRYSDGPDSGLASHIPSILGLATRNKYAGLNALFTSLTTDVETYKKNQMLKLHGRFANRKVICIGDSTQSDPEAYAAIYRQCSGWVKGIFIRKVTDVPHMEEKNKEERFERAFEGVPKDVWMVFEKPQEVREYLEGLEGRSE